ncbi:hypothetical protein HPE56_17660 [Maribacter sp. ANRC-HE7]|uniref:DUF5018 domain-containing protein n=1 Tax=Maribacter aquimaris TaxID=2737171 RepID=A0ABR7V5A7_9FLAO|nr:hypothetical protein [Maribacter aquimaris]MBD0779632.1 hypothetical protein [Maribacter aquimaris]
MFKNPLALFLLTLLFIGCSKNESNESPEIPEEEILSDAKEIISFKVSLDSEVYTAIIRNDSIFYTFPSTADLTGLAPVITYSEKAGIEPASEEVVDFTDPVKYTVTAEDDSKKEYMAVLDKYDSENEIKWVSFDVSGSYSSGIYNQNPADIDTLYYTFTYADITDLQAQMEVSEGATLEPDPAGISDYSSPVKYTVTGVDGTSNEIFVLAKNWPLKALKIDGFVDSEFADVPLGGDITFEVNELTPYRDSIQVRLFSELESFDLEVKGINEETKEITATLPEDYTNNRFALEVSIASDNTDESDGFRLLKGKSNFTRVVTPYNDGNPIPVEKAIWPGHYLDLYVYIKDDAVDDHQFFLLKDGIYYELIKKDDYNVSITSGVRVEMPELPDVLPAEGTDYKLVIRNADGEELFDLTNSEGNKIEVVFAKEPVVNSLSVDTVRKDGTFKILGENLFNGPVIGYTNSSFLRTRSNVLLNDGMNNYYYVYSEEVDANGNLIVDLSTRSYMPTGTYNVAYSSNYTVYPLEYIGYSITLTQLPSEHPTLEVAESKLYSDSNGLTPKQMLLTFNGNIENYNVKRIVTGKNEAVLVENYLTYPTTVLTGSLSNEDYDLTVNDRDGYVVVEDNGIEYKIYFTMQLED